MDIKTHIAFPLSYAQERRESSCKFSYKTLNFHVSRNMDMRFLFLFQTIEVYLQFLETFNGNIYFFSTGLYNHSLHVL